MENGRYDFQTITFQDLKNATAKADAETSAKGFQFVPFGYCFHLQRGRTTQN